MNTVVRIFRMTGTSVSFLMQEKRPFRINAINISSNEMTRKTYLIVIKKDGVHEFWRKSSSPDTVENVVIQELDNIDFDKDTTIDITMSQAYFRGNRLDKVEMYIQVEFLNTVLEDSFDAAVGGLKVSMSGDAGETAYTDGTSYSGGSAWDGAAPVTVAEAINRIANFIATQHGSVIS